MTRSWPSRVRRLAADLLRSETRPDALRRVRRKVAGVVRRRILGSRAPSAPPAKRGTDPRYASEWSRLAGAVLATDVAADPAKFDLRTGTEAVARVRLLRHQAAFAEALGRGESLEHALCASVGQLAGTQEWEDWNAGWALAEGAKSLPGGATASVLAHAILLHRRRQFDRVWRLIRTLDDETLATHIPIEAVDAALAAGTDDAHARAETIATRTDVMDEAALVDLAGRFLALEDRVRAAGLVEELRRRPSTELDDRRRYAWRLIESWLDRPASTIAAGSIPIAVLDYQTPDHVLTSGNLGDYIQTLSLVGNLARLTSVSFTGDDGLGDLAAELQNAVRAELRLPGPSGAIHLLPVDRDFSTGRAVPEGTWLFAFGWHMHPLFDLRYDFPYHPNIRPLFLSFHVNRLDMLTEPALAYLRRYGPVGCRDWNTVFLLLSAGVDAFFTGCLTTTVDALFPKRDDVYKGNGVVALIDKPARRPPPGENVRAYNHQSDDYRYMSAADGVRAARDVLLDYQRELDRAITGRLHAYLPLVSVGVPVEFATSSPGDVRFAGLMDLQPDDARLTAMRDGLRDLIARMLEKLLSGADGSEIYAFWRELTEDRVTDARARFEAPADTVPTEIDVDAAVHDTLARSRRFGPHDALDENAVTDVVLSFDQNMALAAAVLVESLIANASGPLRLWVLARGLSSSYQEWLAAAFPSLPITVLPCDAISYGPTGRPRRVPARITVSTMDRLLLPEMLQNVQRVVYLDADTLMLDDVCALARIDLDGRAVAARDSTVSEASEWQRAARRLPEGVATDLRRVMGRLHGYGHPALNAGVLVLDLDRMRRDDFTRRYLGWVERFGLHDQDTMLAYVGPERAVIEPRWNAMPVLEDASDPALIHWASFNKPWDSALTFARDVWQDYADRLHRRAGPPPSTASTASAAAVSSRIPEPIAVDAGSVHVKPDVERVIGRVLDEHLSYLGEAGLRSLAATVEEIEATGIEGLIVETGAALGGSAITMAAAKSPERPMKVYDVFRMIPPPSDKDGEDVHRRYRTIVSGGSKGIGGDTYYGYRDGLLTEVTKSFSRHGLPLRENKIELIQGLFQDTLRLDGPVALAHLDGDWYESTLTSLTRIAPLLSPGGRIIVDDYDTWSGCRAAVDEYFANRSGYRFERRARLHIVRV